jgi:nucleotide-binding universal stress UspA family protein
MVTLGVTSIFVPLDGSSLAETALGPAHDLAVAFDVPLVLFRACFSDTDAALDELEALAGKTGSHRTEVVIGQGFAAPAIVRAVAARPGAVVCMSTRGHTGAGAALLGGVAEEVLTTVRRPVVLVGPECSPLALTTRSEGCVVLCFDGSPGAEALVPVVHAWARALHLEVHVVAVVHHDGDRVSDGPAAPVRLRAREIVAELRAVDIEARVAFPTDANPARGLTRYADEQGASLALIAPSRERGALHATVGSVALRVARHATVPVLVV